MLSKPDLIRSILVFAVASPASFASIISYDADIGVLPSDISIPATDRFDETGAMFSTVVGELLVVEDTSSSVKTTFERISPPIQETTIGAYQITMKVISSNRPTLNIAGAVGFNDANKTVRIAMAPDRIGFLAAGGGLSFTHSIPLDTTNGFHTYRVLKHSNNTVQLFVDDLDTPVLDFPYSQLESLSSIDIGPNTDGIAYLWQGSNQGTSLVEIESFAYNVGSTDVPEPSSATYVIVLAAWALRRRKRGVLRMRRAVRT